MVVLIGDSHIKGCSEKVCNLLNDTFNVTGFTKPNATMEAITSPLYFKTQNYTMNVVVLCGGSKDGGKNKTPPCIPDSHPHRITSTKCCINTVVSPDDGPIVARNM